MMFRKKPRDEWNASLESGAENYYPVRLSAGGGCQNSVPGGVRIVFRGCQNSIGHII